MQLVRHIKNKYKFFFERHSLCVWSCHFTHLVIQAKWRCLAPLVAGQPRWPKLGAETITKTESKTWCWYCGGTGMHDMQVQTQNPKNSFPTIINILSPKTNHLVKLHFSPPTYVKLRTSPQNIPTYYFGSLNQNNKLGYFEN